MSLNRSILNLGRWRGALPNVLQGGRVDAHAGSVAAGLIGIKNIQPVLINVTGNLTDFAMTNGDTQTVAINAVVVAKTIVIPLYGYGYVPSQTGSRRSYHYAMWGFTPRITSPTQITITWRAQTSNLAPSASTASNNAWYFYGSILLVEFY